MSTATAERTQTNTPAQDKPRIFLSPPALTGLEQTYVAQAFASNYIAPVGPQLAALEQELAKVTGFKHAIGVSCGTAAIHLMLRVLGVTAGDRVYVSDMTFIGSVAPVLYQNATPVFIDSKAGDFTMDPALLEQALMADAARGQLPKAIMPCDLYGQSCDLDAILAIAARYNITVICDGAESLGARYKDRHAGKGALMSALSFNGNKIITGSGGGAILTDDDALARKLVYYATQAREPVPHYEHTDFGYNYRLSNIMAAIALGQLMALPERVARRQEIYQTYRAGLGDLPGVMWINDPAWSKSTQWLSVMLLDPATARRTPEQLRVYLETENIESRAAWKPMHLQPIFKDQPYIGGAVGQTIFERGLCLPSGHFLTPDDQQRIITLIRAQLA